jgi:hypothetical protein
MVDIVRRKDATIVAKDYSYRNTEAQAYGNWADVAGGVSNAFKANQKKQEEKEKKQAEDYRNMVSSNLKAAQKQMADQKKAFDASDKLVASDMAGRLKNDLLRWNLAQRENNPSYIGTREHESAMRAEYDRLANKYNVGLGEVGMADFQEKTQGYVNTFLDNDIKWAYQQKIKQGEESAKASAQQIEQTAALHGTNGDIQGFKDSYAEMSVPLGEYIGTASPENASKAMGELGQRSLTSFVMGVAETDPVKAKAIVDDPEIFKGVVPDEMLQTASDAMLKQQEGAIKDQIVLLNAGIANEKDKKKKKQLEKLKEKAQEQLNDLGEDVSDQALETIRQDVKKSVDKTIDYKINLMKAEEEKMKAQKRIENSLEFMDNPIIYRAKVGDEQLLNEETYKKFPELKNLQNEIYDLSDKVGDGKVNPVVLHKIVEQVASITVDDINGIDENILKAFEADVALRKAGASPEQLQIYHKLAQKAMTDTAFKLDVAALAGKPDFNTMFLDKPSRDTGLLSWFRTAKDDDIARVEDLGRSAYFECMALMANGEVERALAHYDDRVRQAYDFIKRDVIDADFVKKELAKMGHAMVELNGNMTKITGRLPNGEYIVESTGEKINGGF